MDRTCLYTPNERASSMYFPHSIYEKAENRLINLLNSKQDFNVFGDCWITSYSYGIEATGDKMRVWVFDMMFNEDDGEIEAEFGVTLPREEGIEAVRRALCDAMYDVQEQMDQRIKA